MIVSVFVFVLVCVAVHVSQSSNMIPERSAPKRTLSVRPYDRLTDDELRFRLGLAVPVVVESPSLPVRSLAAALVPTQAKSSVPGFVFDNSHALQTAGFC